MLFKKMFVLMLTVGLTATMFAQPAEKQYFLVDYRTQMAIPCSRIGWQVAKRIGRRNPLLLLTGMFGRCRLTSRSKSSFRR